ncbi:hypothetical protein F0562_019520 [Nyssa sinensis]|uniref:Uncharacterized protein n=1 Tax=Nyssa sinensis TaxID=561372 RepID=A0A5J5BQ09_9ASTE|nr:hypothetical protein F0562_019520 [Nyssa sinensis]
MIGLRVPRFKGIPNVNTLSFLRTRAPLTRSFGLSWVRYTKPKLTGRHRRQSEGQHTSWTLISHALVT